MNRLVTPRAFSTARSAAGRLSAGAVRGSSTRASRSGERRARTGELAATATKRVPPTRAVTSVDREEAFRLELVQELECVLEDRLRRSVVALPQLEHDVVDRAGAVAQFPEVGPDFRKREVVAATRVEQDGRVAGTRERDAAVTRRPPTRIRSQTGT